MKRWLADERGATSIEYGLIAGLVFLVIAGSVAAIADPLGAIFASVVSGLSGP